MERDTLYSNTNTSFNKQQNPLRTFELPCDREYVQMPIGACNYFLLSEYPVDIDVYVSLNPNRKDAFKVDNRNTGFKISDVYTREGVPSFVKDVYVWTEGITNLHDNQGRPASVKIVTSSIPSFEILNNSSINSIESIGQIGSINGLVGYPQGAQVITGHIIPEFVKSFTPPINYGLLFDFEKTQREVSNLGNIISPSRTYIISAQGILDPELVVPLQQTHAQLKAAMTSFIHTHAGLVIQNEGDNIKKPPNGLFSIMAKSFALSSALSEEGTSTRAFYTNGSGAIDNAFSIQFSGEELLRHFVDSEGNIAFELHIREVKQRDGSDEAKARVTNTRLTYQISAYHKS